MDLIQVYEASRQGKNAIPNCLKETPEEQTYQWNRFVKDFNADSQTQGLKNRMKVAALLWRHVRDQKGSKKYQPDLFTHFQQEILEMEEKG